MSEEDTTITLGGVTVRIVQPSSYTQQREIAALAARNVQRALGAAVGACWPAVEPWPGKRRPSYAGCGYDAARYGGLVIDSLHAAGIPIEEISATGIICWTVINDGLYPGEKEVAAAEDFSEAEDPPIG